MRTRFENQLKELNDALIFLGAECEDCLTYSMQALVTGQKVMIERAMECEKNTDSKNDATIPIRKYRDINLYSLHMER